MTSSIGWRRTTAATIAALALGGASLLAHDMWIEPETFAPTAAKIVSVRLRVGQDFIGDPLPRDPSLIKEFVIEDGDGRRDVVGRAGMDPAGLIHVGTPGVSVIGYSSHPSRVDLDGAKFAQYLKDEGLDTIAALRARRGETGAVKELFSRCAKSLLRSGPASAKDGDRTLGFPLELIAERNPYAMAAGDAFPVHLLYQGRPLAGALIIAINQADPATRISARSDAHGHVRLQLPRNGVWLVKAVHMIPAAADAHADWESFWASLTFDLPASTEHATR